MKRIWKQIITMALLLMASVAWGADIPLLTGKDGGVDIKNTLFAALILFFLWTIRRKVNTIAIHVRMNAQIGEIVKIIALKHIENHGEDSVLQGYVDEYDRLKLEATKSEGIA